MLKDINVRDARTDARIARIHNGSDQYIGEGTKKQIKGLRRKVTATKIRQTVSNL